MLESEPSRFGQRFLSNPEEDIELFIDAPALLYHLISLYNKISVKSDEELQQTVPSILQNIVLENPSDNKNQNLSPHTIHKLTLAFCSILKSCVGKNSSIHLVVDGVASIFKVGQQLERMKKDAENLEEARTHLQKTTSQYVVNVPHFFAEDAMIMALHQLEIDDLYHVHYASGEAESYISRILFRRDEDDFPSNIKRRIILSNDTDFIILPVGGFIPLHSIEYVQSQNNYTNKSGVWKIHGWEFLRSRFMTAFGLKACDIKILSYQENLLITSTIAALAGCDYTLKGKHKLSIVNARSIIVQSNIGGLRQKNRNNSSAKDTIIAVSRFVSHFVSKMTMHSRDHDGCVCNNKLWLDLLIDKVFDLKFTKQALKRRRCGKREDEKNNGRLSPEEQKKVLKEAFHLIFEIYNDGTCSSEGNFSVREARRLMQHNHFFYKPIMANGIDRKRKPLNDQFLDCRRRIYSLLFHENTSVIEYSFLKDGFEIRLNAMDIKVEIDLCKELLRETIDEIDLLSYALFGNQINFHLLKMRLQQVNIHVLFISLLLPDKDALMLLLMHLLQWGDCQKHCSADLGSPQIDKLPFLESQSRIQIAHFHFKLALEIIAITRKFDKVLEWKCDLSLCKGIHHVVSTYGDYTQLSILWSIVERSNISHEMPISKPMDIFKQTFKINDLSFQKCWIYIERMWKVRLRCLEMTSALR